MFVLIGRKVCMYIYTCKHTYQYFRHTPETSVKSKSYFPSPFLNLSLCYAANFTDLLGSDTAYHSNLGYSYKPSLNIKYWKVSFLALHFWKDVNQLERIWRKATGMSRGLENITYEKRLKVPRLFSLERSRWRGKILIVFKYQLRLSLFQADDW